MEEVNDFNLFADKIQKKRMKVIERYLKHTHDFYTKYFHASARYVNRHKRVSTMGKYYKLSFKNCNDVIKANHSFHDVKEALPDI